MVNECLPDQKMINVDVVYSARAGHLWQVKLTVQASVSIADVLQLSGCYQLFAELQAETIQVGVFNLKQPHDASLNEGDRLEIYRPLIADPKDNRRRRAKLANFEGGLDKTTQKQKPRRFRKKLSSI